MILINNFFIHFCSEERHKKDVKNRENRTANTLTLFRPGGGPLEALPNFKVK